MRQIELHIAGQAADLDNDSFILYNWTREDMESPAAVKNSFSQTVRLPGTDANNRIFNEYFRVDRMTFSGGFDATARVPFEIWCDGEILQSGYCRLDAVERIGSGVTYSVMLFGGLGGFFYGLTYNEDGDKLSLASLSYLTQGSDDLQFRITREAVLSAWSLLADDGGDGAFNDDFNDDYETSQRRWAVLNFAPCYNGIPKDKFTAGKAIGRTGTIYGLDNGRRDEDGNRCYDSGGYTLIDLAGERDEWMMRDLRSYMQRPVIAVRAIIKAIAQYAQRLGYTLNLDTTFFADSNPYYGRTWITLPMLSEIETRSEHVEGGWIVPSGRWTDEGEAYVQLAQKAIGEQTEIEASIRMKAWTQYSPGRDGLYLGFADRTLGNEVRNGMVLQLVGYDADDAIVAASDVVSLQSEVFGATLATSEVMTAAEYVAKGGAAAGAVYEGHFEGDAMHGWEFSRTVQFTLRGAGIAYLRLYAVAAQCVNDFSGQYEVGRNDLFEGPEQIVTPEGYIKKTSVEWEQGGQGTEAYDTSVDARSGVLMTKGALLGGTQTPADYLLSFAKMFGLIFTYDDTTRTIGVMTRSTFYGGGEAIIDLDGRVDEAQGRTIKPYTFSAHWYEWSAAMRGAFAEYYEGVYGRQFGLQRVNTGYDFDSSRSEVMKGSALKGCAEVMHRGEGNVNVTMGLPVLNAALKTGVKYTLYNPSGEGVEFEVPCVPSWASFEWWNGQYKYYDAEGRPELCDAEGKVLDGKDVMLFFDGMTETEDGAYARVCVTDDAATMARLNEQTPCWWAEPATVYAPVVAIPHFGRYIHNGSSIKRSLDYGRPAELGVIGQAQAANCTVYERYWSRYIADRYDRDTKVLTAKVDLRGLPIGEGLLRRFYAYGGALWTINKIVNYSLRDIVPVECELVQVQDMSNYTNGIMI